MVKINENIWILSDNGEWMLLNNWGYRANYYRKDDAHTHAHYSTTVWEAQEHFTSSSF